MSALIEELKTAQQLSNKWQTAAGNHFRLLTKVEMEADECKVILERLKDVDANKELLMGMLERRIQDILALTYQRS